VSIYGKEKFINKVKGNILRIKKKTQNIKSVGKIYNCVISFCSKVVKFVNPMQ
jgi:hypothetical protein